MRSFLPPCKNNIPCRRPDCTGSHDVLAGLPPLLRTLDCTGDAARVGPLGARVALEEDRGPVAGVHEADPARAPAGVAGGRGVGGHEVHVAVSLVIQLYHGGGRVARSIVPGTGTREGVTGLEVGHECRVEGPSCAEDLRLSCLQGLEGGQPRVARGGGAGVVRGVHVAVSLVRTIYHALATVAWGLEGGPPSSLCKRYPVVVRCQVALRPFRDSWMRPVSRRFRATRRISV